MSIYPIKLKYVPKDIIWGGTKLREKFNKVSPFDRIAESWELTLRDDGMSVIANGRCAGQTLAQYVTDNPASTGTDVQGDAFPLLIKFIDACEDLSVQVHPDDEYALANEGECGKTEMWYIVDAEEGASIVYGLIGDVDDKISSVSETAELTGALNRINVRRGEAYFIPAGQVHAICKGVLIAEIQQNSNITYRIYDYDREDANGKKRELHTRKALDVIKVFTNAEIDRKRFSGRLGRRECLCSGEVLADCEYFRVTSVRCDGEVSFTVDEKAFASLLFTDVDDACVFCGNSEVSVSAGDCVFIPAGAGLVKLRGKADLLLSEI